ncbi:MAG: hypothetical protein AB1394_05850 [Bacteroidota bacterium]
MFGYAVSVYFKYALEKHLSAVLFTICFWRNVFLFQSPLTIIVSGA